MDLLAVHNFKGLRFEIVAEVKSQCHGSRCAWKSPVGLARVLPINISIAIDRATTGDIDAGDTLAS
jgi:hypothetical protein